MRKARKRKLQDKRRRESESQLGSETTVGCEHNPMEEHQEASQQLGLLARIWRLFIGK